jgi:hypothetical protein
VWWVWTYAVILTIGNGSCQQIPVIYPYLVGNTGTYRKMGIYRREDSAVTTKKPKVTIYLSEEQKADLDNWAKSQKRSVSNLVSFLVDQALEDYKQKDGDKK